MKISELLNYKKENVRIENGYVIGVIVKNNKRIKFRVLLKKYNEAIKQKNEITRRKNEITRRKNMLIKMNKTITKQNFNNPLNRCHCM